MRLSYNWLKQILPSLKVKPEKLAEILNMQVAEIEGVIKLSQGLEKIIVAEIIKIKPHPQADKLQVAVVNTGKEKREIVCGAPNIKAGQKVPLALKGAMLRFLGATDDKAKIIEIKESVIRGVKSQGMLCAEDELGFGPDHQGIYILPSETKIGQPLTKALGLDDIILELENKSLTHRPDLFNHLGCAREIGAILGIKAKIQDLKLRGQKSTKTPLEIKVQDTELCPRYMAVIMEGIKVGPSPKWMQDRLRNLGIKPINNVVDITNYILIEVGQPLHAFDAAKIAEKKIIIRKAKKGEKLLALDSQEYKLTDNDLVIADAKKPVALAGVIGGERSGITESTKRIVIESANFNPTNIRRTAWRLGLRTEAVIRFEKGLPMIFPEWGLTRAIELIQELAQGQIISKIYDIKSKEVNKELKQKKEIVFDPERVRKFIGLEIKNEAMKKILKNLGAEIRVRGKKFLIRPPAHRPDLNLFEDLVEEVVRVYGTEKIIPQPILGKLEPAQQLQEFILEKELKNILTGCGFDEVYNYSFYSQETITDSNFEQNKHLEIANPLNPSQQYLRISLIPGLLKNAGKNSRNFSEFKIFEIGRVFCPGEKTKVAGLIFSGDKDIYFITKGLLELIFDKIGLDQEKVKYGAGGLNRTDISLNKEKLGYFGLVQDNTTAFELDFEYLLKFAQEAKKYQSIPAYPPVKRDLAFLIDKKIAWDEVEETVKNIDSLIKEIEVFDVFEDKKFGDKCNLAFHITYQSFDRTLKAEEVEKIEKKIIKTMEEKFRAQLRNF